METSKLPPFRIPNCQHPLILVNPRALYLLQEQGVPSAGWLAPVNNVNEIDVKSLLRRAYGIVHSRKRLNYMLLKQFYVDLDGRVEYMFNIVGCQKCPTCIKKKRDDFSVRCQMESELYDCPAYFFTLTYDPRHLPKDGQLHVSHVQDFFKRLRIRWTRKGLDHSIRYVVAGEYGKKRKRPHYHVIMWNNPYHASELDPGLELQLKLDIFDAWSQCEWQAFDFQQCFGGAAQYASKYVYKRSYVSKRNWIKPFLLTSRGNGGIGSALIRKYVDQFRRYASLDKIGWTSRFDGVYREFGIGSYAKSILRPGLSRLVPSGVSFHYHDLVRRLERHVMNGALESLEAYSIAEGCRPCKSVTINPMVSDRTLNPVNKTCWLYAVWLFNKERQHMLLNSQMLKDQVDVSPSVIDDYYRWKLYGYDQDRDPMLDIVQKDFVEQAIQDVVTDKSIS